MPKNLVQLFSEDYIGRTLSAMAVILSGLLGLIVAGQFVAVSIILFLAGFSWMSQLALKKKSG